MTQQSRSTLCTGRFAGFLALAVFARSSAQAQSPRVVDGSGSLLSHALVADRQVGAITMEELSMKVDFANELSRSLRSPEAGIKIPAAISGRLAGADFSYVATPAPIVGSGFPSEQGAFNSAAAFDDSYTTMDVTPVPETSTWVAGILAAVVLGLAEFRRSGFSRRLRFYPFL